MNEDTNQQEQKGNGVLPCVSGCLLPTKSMIEKMITVEYMNMYGTNYDDNSLECAKQGAMLLANWLLNNR
jgi:hypothetical protein